MSLSIRELDSKEEIKAHDLYLDCKVSVITPITIPIHSQGKLRSLNSLTSLRLLFKNSLRFIFMSQSRTLLQTPLFGSASTLRCSTNNPNTTSSPHSKTLLLALCYFTSTKCLQQMSTRCALFVSI